MNCLPVFKEPQVYNRHVMSGDLFRMAHYDFNEYEKAEQILDFSQEPLIGISLWEWKYTQYSYFCSLL